MAEAELGPVAPALEKITLISPYNIRQGVNHRLPYFTGQMPDIAISAKDHFSLRYLVLISSSANGNSVNQVRDKFLIEIQNNAGIPPRGHGLP